MKLTARCQHRPVEPGYRRTVCRLCISVIEQTVDGGWRAIAHGDDVIRQGQPRRSRDDEDLVDADAFSFGR